MTRLRGVGSTALIVVAIAASASNAQEPSDATPALVASADSGLAERRGFTWHAWQHACGSVAGVNAGVHLGALSATWLMVESGVDADVQRWAARRDGNVTWGLRMPALAGGALLPMVLPIWLYVSADRRGDAYVANGAAAAGQAVVLAYVTNTLLKALTGRVPPDNEMSLDVDARARRFQFGFMRGGVFNGWPSGHSMVNMAMAASFANYFHDVAWVPIVAYSWAAYVMAAVVVGGQVHWLSEAVAGGAMGWAIGRTVGRGFAAGPQDLTTGVQVLPAAMPGGGGIVVSVPLERR